MNGLQCIHLDKKLAGPKLEFLNFESLKTVSNNKKCNFI